jgi:glycosyltransferase involved in cell wall biosynthesis
VPIVSVIVPAYNAAKYIEGAIASVLSVAGDIAEVIIVDDGSTDATKQIAERLVREHPQVRCVSHPGCANKGAGASRNLGVAFASTDYVAFLDADDLYLPGRFEGVFELLADPTIVAVVGSTGYLWDGVPSAPGDNRADGSDVGGGALFNYDATVDVSIDCLRCAIEPWATNSITVRRSWFDLLGGFDESLRLHQDTHLWIRLLLSGPVVCSGFRQPVALYRRHAANRFDLADEGNWYRGLMLRASLAGFASRVGKSAVARRGLEKADAFREGLVTQVVHGLVVARRGGKVLSVLKSLLVAGRGDLLVVVNRPVLANLAYLFLERSLGKRRLFGGLGMRVGDK